MPVPKNLLTYLDKNKTKYAVIPHKTVYTAYDTAQTLRKKLEEIAKNLLLKADRFYILAILPASKNVDLKKLKSIIEKNLKHKIGKLDLPKEKVMTQIFKVKPGALPAFGAINQLPVYLDKALYKVKKAIFTSGSFEDSIEMALKDFEKLEKPIVGLFSVAKKIKPVKKAKTKKSKPKKKRK